MSITVNESVNENVVVLTEKFEKELVKCFKWLNESGYVVKDVVDGAEVGWQMSLLVQFIEPGRNKLECYIKEIIKNYIIEFGGKTIDDYKLIVKEFKESKASKISNKKSDDKLKEKKVEKSKKEKNTEITKTEKSKKTKKLENKIEEIVINMNLCTSDTYYLDTLVYTTQQLVNILGDPEKTGNESTKHQFEWKFMIRNNVYTIYDWKNEDGEFSNFEDAEWFLGGNSEDEENIKMFYQLMTKKLEDIEIETIQQNLNNTQLTINEDEFEIDLDDIEF